MIYYPFETFVLDNGSTFDIYTGEPVDIGGDVPPTKASQWEPPTVMPGSCIYHDGIGWVPGRDVRTMTFEQLQQVVLRRANLELDATVNDLGSSYSDAERATWAHQLADAQAFLAGGEASALLEKLAEAQNEDVKDLANKIVANDQAYKEVHHEAVATAQKTKASVQAATEIKDLPSISLRSIVLPGVL